MNEKTKVIEAINKYETSVVAVGNKTDELKAAEVLRKDAEADLVRTRSEVEAVGRAYSEAARHLPCKEGEIVVCHPVRDRTRRLQAKLMQLDWERALRKFEELMTC